MATKNNDKGRNSNKKGCALVVPSPVDLTIIPSPVLVAFL